MADRPPLDTASLGSLINDAADAVVVVDQAGTVRFANEAVLTILGYEPSALIGEHYELLVPPDLRRVHGEHHQDFLATPEPRPMGAGLTLSAQHSDGYVIDVEIALVPVRSDELLVAAFLRDTSVQQRYVQRLSAGNELVTAALAGEPTGRLTQRAVNLARSILHGCASWVVLLDQHEDAVDIVAQSGDDAPPWLHGLMYDADFVSGVELSLAMDGGEIARRRAAPIADETEGAAENGVPLTGVLMAPMRTDGTTGLLVVARGDVGPRFDDYDAQVLEEFAATVALTRALVTAREELEEYRSIADRDRIARDLHDVVIQRLFAIAMRLEAVVPAASSVAAERMGETVDALDEVIRDIRTTIFNLRRRTGSDVGLRAELAAEVDRSVATLGFAPRLSVAGLVDFGVDIDVADTVLATVRELLANVARHAGATTVDVSVRSADGVLTIRVEDDGVGLPESVALGEGLRNVESRAVELGGSFAIRRRESGGTIADWTMTTGSTRD